MNIDLQHIKRFLISGGSATLLHFSLMGLLIYLGVKPAIATGIGAIFGAVFNYILQYHYTFRSDGSHIRTVSAYIITVAAGLLSNEVLFIFFYDYLGQNALFAQLLTTTFVTIQNYIFYKYIVFKGKK